MKNEFKESYPPEVREKVRKNIIWFLVISISMMFAGFTSAYIVSMGDSFWVKFSLPTPFYISTTLIIISSIILILANKAVKKGNLKRARIFIIGTLIFGIGFAVFQFLGYKKLVNDGAYAVSHIIVNKGRYGNYYEIKKDGKYLTVNNNAYYFDGKKMEGKQKKAFQSFAQQFLVPNLAKLQKKKLKFADFTLLYKSEPLTYKDGKLIRPNGKSLQRLDFERLHALAKNIVDNRADFFISGELGKDFHLYYNENELQYKQRTLMYKGQALSPNLQNKLLRGNQDKSTSYFYIITILHLLHVIAGLIFLIVMAIRSYPKDNPKEMAVSLSSGTIFWHFLGILWIYLLLFLIFIH